jgi:hypothetical protein
MKDVLTHEAVITFLLDCPPLTEIGGPIVDMVEAYRQNVVTKKKAIELIMKLHKKFIDKYINNSIDIVNAYVD